MIFGSCPYCDHSASFSIGNQPTPFWGHETCEACGKTFWEEYSRINPRAYTEEAFAERYTVDEKTKQIREKPRSQVDPKVEELVEKTIDQAMKDAADRMIYGTLSRVEPQTQSNLVKEFHGLRARETEVIVRQFGVSAFKRVNES